MQLDIIYSNWKQIICKRIYFDPQWDTTDTTTLGQSGPKNDDNKGHLQTAEPYR